MVVSHINDNHLTINRIQVIDFIKGIMIVLMIQFHISAFSSSYPLLTQIVYSFHMPVFLLLSGMLFNVEKNIRLFYIKVKQLCIIYLVFETLYLIGIAILGKFINSSNLYELSLLNIINSILRNPIGTYWYLYTIIICYIVSYSANYIFRNKFITIIISISIIYYLTYVTNLKIENVFYFIIGYIFKDYNIFSIANKKNSIIFILIFIITCLAGITPQRNNCGGFILTMSSLAIIISFHKQIHHRISFLISYLGVNSLSLVLLSPFFTILTKQLLFLFSFDKSNILFGLISTFFVIVLSLFSAKLIDKSKIIIKLANKSLYHPLS